MKTYPIKKRKIIKLMTSPEARYISLVGHAATQVPINELKSDAKNLYTCTEKVEPETETTVEQKEIEQALDVVQKQTAKENKYELAKIEFSKKQFQSFDQVEDFLASKNYDSLEYEITEKQQNFEVLSVDYQKFSENFAKINHNKEGVTLFVGEILPENNDSVEKTAIKKVTDIENMSTKEQTAKTNAAPELVKLYEEWSASYSGHKNFNDVVAAGFNADHLPPGLYELNWAFITAVRNCIEDNDISGITKAATDYGSLLVDLINLFMEKIDTMPDETQKTLKSAFVKALEDGLPSKQVTEKQPEKAADEEPIPADEPVAAQQEQSESPETKQDSEDQKSDEPVSKEDNSSEDATEVSESVEAKEETEKQTSENNESDSEESTDSVTELASVIKEALAPLLEQVNAVKESVQSLNERTDKLETQTRKSVDSENVYSADSTTTKKDTEFARRSITDQIGM